MPLAAAALIPSLAAVARAGGARSAASRSRRTAAHAVTVAGAAGMGWSLLLLFAFQTHAGALHGQLGALVAVFMLGLAVGGALAPRALLGAREGLPAASRALCLCLAGAFVFSASLPFTLEAAARASQGSSAAALVAYGALLLAAGAITGSVFPVAVTVRLAAGETAGEAAGRRGDGRPRRSRGRGPLRRAPVRPAPRHGPDRAPARRPRRGGPRRRLLLTGYTLAPMPETRDRLSEQIHLLGDLLGQTIVEQEGARSSTWWRTCAAWPRPTAAATRRPASGCCGASRRCRWPRRAAS